MSDQHGDPTPAHLDDDTSVGAVTQGGHGTRRGNSIWWVIAVVAIVLALAVAWFSTRHGDIIGHGSRTASSLTTYNIRSNHLG